MSYAVDSTFKVTIDDMPTVSWYCNTFELPGINLNVSRQQTPFASIPHAQSTADIDDLSIGFIVDENMSNWIELFDRITALGLTTGFQDYKSLINSTPDLKNVGESTITLEILNNMKNIINTIQFFDAVPTSVSALSFTTATTDFTQLTSTATFAFSYYTINRH